MFCDHSPIFAPLLTRFNQFFIAPRDCGKLMLLLFNFRKEQKNYFEMNSHLTTNININMNIINEHIESIEGRADNATAKDVNAILKT